MKEKNTLISFQTKDKLLLQGVWLGAVRAKTVYVFIHGLYSNLFSQAGVAELLSKQKNTAVLLFNNRGYGYISKVRRKEGATIKSQIMGGAHEIFIDSHFDVAAAVSYAKLRGATRIILVGHSTGSQKSVWYLTRKPDPVVVGAILLAPLSDYAGKQKEMGDYEYIHAQKVAREHVLSGTPHALMPSNVSPTPCDAQRWLSLYTPESPEEIFSYAGNTVPVLLRKVRAPLVACFSKGDQYADRPAAELSRWFSSVQTRNTIATEIVAAQDHGFSGQEKKLFSLISKYTKTW